MNKYFLVVLLSLFMQVAKVAAAPWQWSVEIKELISEETNAHPSEISSFISPGNGQWK